MKLTKKEKSLIFFALIDKYPEHEKNREGAIKLFSDRENILKKVIDEINKTEFSSYKLLKRFADELEIKIPAYKEPMPLAKFLEVEYRDKFSEDE